MFYVASVKTGVWLCGVLFSVYFIPISTVFFGSDFVSYLSLKTNDA